MSKQGAHRPLHFTVWHLVFCLTLVAFVYRSLIPAGFMPDARALQDGRVEITFCTVNAGVSTARLNLADKSGQGTGQDAVTSPDCPFGLLAAQAVMPPINASVVLAAVFHYEQPAPYNNTALPSLPAQGPPLGPRAPPFNLG